MKHRRPPFTASSHGGTVSIERMELALVPEKSAPVRLIARGSIDRAKGEITLVTGRRTERASRAPSRRTRRASAFWG